MSTSPSPRVIAGADHRDVYLLALGIVLGVLIGPQVLGRWAPAAYDRLFVGGGQAQRELDDFDRHVSEELRRLNGTGATKTAIEEKAAELLKDRAEKSERRDANLRQHAAWLAGQMNALLLALLVFMIVEAVTDPASAWGARFRNRLATVRYALMALWLALLLGQQQWLRDVPLAFLALLVVVALLAAVVPLRRREGT